MPSKVLEEFLKKASRETKADLKQIQQDLQRSGVEDKAPQQPNQPEPVSKVAERPDVKRIGQDLQRNGVELKQDTYGPQTPARIGESRSHIEIPKFMDERSPNTQQQPAGEKSGLQQTRQDLQREGRETAYQTPKRENAVDRAKASSERAPAQSQEKQKSQELER